MERPAMTRLRPLHLDFAERSPPKPRWSMVLLGVGLLACATVALNYQAAAGDLAELESQRGSLERRVERLSAVGGGGTAAARFSAQAVEAAQQLRRPWNALLSDLEAAVGESSGSVALLSVEPEVTQRQLRITGEARQLADILAFVGRLGSAASLHQPTLTAHQSRQSEGVPVIAFTISAGWKEGG